MRPRESEPPGGFRLIPGGGIFFTESTDAQGPSFGNYNLGGAFTYNVNPFVGIEGEVGGDVGISQDLDFGFPSSVRTPHMLTYAGNLVLTVPTGRSVVPYVTGGAGGLSAFKTEDLGINDTETFFTGNLGGGLKWYTGRWGLRADYRFIAVQSKDDAPAFFGTEPRYGHRVYGAVIVNVDR